MKGLMELVKRKGLAKVLTIAGCSCAGVAAVAAVVVVCVNVFYYQGAESTDANATETEQLVDITEAEEIPLTDAPKTDFSDTEETKNAEPEEGEAQVVSEEETAEEEETTEEV